MSISGSLEQVEAQVQSKTHLLKKHFLAQIENWKELKEMLLVFGVQEIGLGVSKQ